MGQTYRIAVAANDERDRNALRHSLVVARHDVVLETNSVEPLMHRLDQNRPDLVIAAVDLPGADGLAGAQTVIARCNRPVIILAEEFDDTLVDQLSANGAAGVLFKPVRRDTLLPAVALATARHRETQALCHELAEAKQSLCERKLIEQAKGILMRSRALDEAAAFQYLQRTARNQRRKLAEIAEMIVLAEKVLGTATTDPATSR